MKPGQGFLKTDHRPLYDQAIDALNRFIKDGGYKPGDQLPAEGRLAKELGISRPTLREAFGTLENSGIIERRHGVGTFVTSPAEGVLRGGLEQLLHLRAMAELAGVSYKSSALLVNRVQVDEKIAEHLNLHLDEEVICIEMTARTDTGQHLAYMRSFIGFEQNLYTEVQNYRNGSLLNFLLEKGDPKLSYTHTHIYSVSTDRQLARWLHAPLEKPLLLLEETYFTNTGDPVMHEYNYFLGDNLDFHIIRRIVN